MRFQPPHTKRNGGKLIFQKLFFFFCLKFWMNMMGNIWVVKKRVVSVAVYWVTPVLWIRRWQDWHECSTLLQVRDCGWKMNVLSGSEKWSQCGNDSWRLSKGLPIKKSYCIEVSEKNESPVTWCSDSVSSFIMSLWSLTGYNPRCGYLEVHLN